MTDAEYEQKYENLLRDKTVGLLAGTGAKLFLFGSRARGETRLTADFDLGVEGLPVPEYERFCREVQDFWEESVIPHKIDIVNFNLADKTFLAQAKQTVKIWKS